MMTLKKTVAGLRLAIAAALFLSGLAIAATAGVASASILPGHTIARARTLAVPHSASGGGGRIDFWKVRLNGGADVQFAVPATGGNYYSFALFAPSTTDTSFPHAKPFAESGTNVGSPTVFDLLAPYTGTFVLAVCENTGNCPSVENGGGTNPMNPYTFTTKFYQAISSRVAKAETKAKATIAGARAMGVGHFESGGANGVDFWKVPLKGGAGVEFTVPATGGNYYSFALFAPGTTDISFAKAKPFAESGTNVGSPTVFDLLAPYTGTFVLAVCENTGNCPSVENGGGTNPMNPYTFTTKFYQAISSRVAKAETKANATIAGARAMGLGHFESGGANGVDFWKVPLKGGADVQFTVPATGGNYYSFALFAPGTTDTSFPDATAIVTKGTNVGSPTVFDLTAPHTGTFILAVCENTGSCPSVENGGGTNPMNPYTFTTKPTRGSVLTVKE
jgi:uncharacterized cupredoxin-like copper-binding protein